MPEDQDVYADHGDDQREPLEHDVCPPPHRCARLLEDVDATLVASSQH